MISCVGAKAYLICYEYPAHPPADGSSTAKSSADNVWIVTLRFARCSSSLCPGFDVCCSFLWSVVAVEQHVDITTQHNTIHHNSTYCPFSFTYALVHSTRFVIIPENTYVTYFKNTRNEARETHNANMPACMPLR